MLVRAMTDVGVKPVFLSSRDELDRAAVTGVLADIFPEWNANNGLFMMPLLMRPDGR